MNEEELLEYEPYINYEEVVKSLKEWLEEYKDIGEFRMILDKLNELMEYWR